VPICACTGAADTIMHRTKDATAAGIVPVSVVALFLKNSGPVTLNGVPVDVYVTVNHSNGVIGQKALPQPDPLPESIGQLTVHPNGTFDSAIHVIADVIVVAKGAGANANPKLHQRGPDVDLKSVGSPWSSTPPAGYPNECFFPGNGFYPGGAWRKPLLPTAIRWFLPRTARGLSHSRPLRATARRAPRGRCA